MTTLYTEHASLSDVPPPVPGWVTLGLAKNGQINDFGLSRKMTLGERFLGRITKFYHVNMTQQSEVLNVSALSDTGRYEFPVRIEVDFRVADARALIASGGSVEKHLLAPMRRMIFPRAKSIAAADFAVLEVQLQQMLDPLQAGPSSYEMFEVTAIAVDVQPPPDYALVSGDLEDIRDIKLRIAAALSRGDKQAAENMASAATYMRGDKYTDLDDYSVKLDKVTELLKKRGQLELEADGPVETMLLTAIDRKIEELGGVPPELTKENGGQAKAKSPKDAGDDEFGDVD